MPTKLLNTFDHETSLISAAAFLGLAAYLGYLCQLFLLHAIFRGRNGLPRVSKPQAVATIVLLMVTSELPSWLQPTDGLADLVHGTDPRINDILAMVPSIRLGPVPPPFFRNRHIQFFPFLIQNEIHRREGIAFQRLHVTVSDCLNKTKDCIPSSSLHMTDTITLDVFPPFDDDDESPYRYSQGFNSSSPVIFFAPGLRCYSQDMPGNSVIRRAYGKGFRSIVVNRRGHTPNQLLKSPRWNLFGDVDDLEQVYWYIKHNWVSPNTPMFLYGVSSGTAVTVAAVAKWDKRRLLQPDTPTPSFVATVDITPGYDTSKALLRERFLFPYNDLMLGGVKDHFVIQNEAVLRNFSNETVDKVLAATNLQELVNAAAPFAGYENADLYYQDTNPVNDLQYITTPKLVLNSMDDPCCTISSFYEQSPYPQHRGKTYAQMVTETENAIVAVAWSGSHCPFLCSRNGFLPFVKDPMNGGWMLNSWADEVVVDYFVAALKIYNERRFF